MGMTSWLRVGNWVRSVMDEGEPFSPEVGEALPHRSHLLAGVARPSRELADDPDRLAGAIGTSGIAGKLFIGEFGSSSRTPVGSTM